MCLTGSALLLSGEKGNLDATRGALLCMYNGDTHHVNTNIKFIAGTWAVTHIMKIVLIVSLHERSIEKAIYYTETHGGN